MGIVFHTSYSGKDMISLSASYGTARGIGSSSVFLASASYKDTSGSATFNRGELARFDGLIRMAQGSLHKAGPVLDEMGKSTRDPLSVGFRLKSFFNYYIKNNKGGMGKVRVMQSMFRDYYENFIDQ